MASDKKTAAGNTSMLLLQLLSERDMYGYEMIETLGKRSENLFELKRARCILCFTPWNHRSFCFLMRRR